MQESNFQDPKSRSHPDRSVRKVVANILRQAEESIPPSESNRYGTSFLQYEDESAVFGDVEDEESAPEVERFPNLLDACTQTSPFSLSRSSSFTWMSEGDLEEHAQLEKLVFPGMNSTDFYPGVPPPAPVVDSSSNSECDSEISDGNMIANVTVKRPEALGLTAPKVDSNGFIPDEDSLMLSDASGLASSEEEEYPTSGFRPLTPPRNYFFSKENYSTGTTSSIDSFQHETIIRNQSPETSAAWMREEESLRGRKSEKKKSQPSDSAFDESLKLLLLYTTDEGLTLGPEGSKEPSPTALSSSVSAFTPIRANAESRKPPSASRGLIREEKSNSFAAQLAPADGPDIQLTGDGVVVNRPPFPTPLFTSSQQFPGPLSQGRRLLVQAKKEQAEERLRVLQSLKRERNSMAEDGSQWMPMHPPIQSSVAESVYDNVPNLRRQLASQGLLRPTVDSWSLIPDEEKSVFSPGSDSVGSPSVTLSTIPSFFGGIGHPPPPLPRDISMASGILADSESSPVSPERERFAILDSNDAVAAATPDSVKSITSSEGSCSLAISGSIRSGSQDYPILVRKEQTGLSLPLYIIMLCCVFGLGPLISCLVSFRVLTILSCLMAILFLLTRVILWSR